MKALRGSLTAKIIAILLLCVSGIVFLISSGSLLALENYGAFSWNASKFREAENAYYVEESSPVPTPVQTDTPDTATVKEDSAPKPTLEPLPKRTPEPTAEPAPELKAESESPLQAALHKAYHQRFAFMASMLISFACGIALLVFLFSAAGHRDASDVITLNAVDRLPYDLFTVLCGCAFVIPMVMIEEFYHDDFLSDLFVMIMLGVAILLAGLIVLLFCMSTATRLKLHCLLRSCMLWRAFAWLGRQLQKFLNALPMIWRGVSIVLAVFLVEAFFMVVCVRPSERSDVLFLLACKDVFVMAGAVYLLMSAQKLRAGAKALAEGKLSQTVDTAHLHFALKEHAEDLNRIGESINIAVEERLKSERFRTELITNVSHDIRTPLTSVISYVDLLEKEEPENEKMKEYLAALARQSSKLKKLIEDLIEASKASTGNLTVQAERCDLNILLQQMEGEFTERFAAAKLTPVVSLSKEPLYIMADGRHMWRIFDNLLSNICKYSLENTRVYLSAEKDAEKATVVFRNISKEITKLDAEELTERFVRGDASRSTEGSGLGLSIADSLCRLQYGELSVSTDGDLFKVTLCFPLASTGEILSEYL